MGSSEAGRNFGEGRSAFALLAASRSDQSEGEDGRSTAAAITSAPDQTVVDVFRCRRMQGMTVALPLLNRESKFQSPPHGVTAGTSSPGHGIPGSCPG
jgi:hypothetical protein